jgi:chemotaxis receptor (MCP) glutamine deamidase CheD
MTVRDHLDAPGVQVEIVATDIDTQVLAHARAGVYDAPRMAGVPADVRARHFVQKEGARGKVFQLRTEARDVVRFERFNLTGDRWAIGEPFDLVFCRNVIIYFDRATQVGLFERFARVVAPHGYLVLGHSESLHGVSDRFRSIGVTVYAPAAAAVAGRRSRASRAVRPAAAGRVSRASRAVRPAAERRRTGHPAVATGLPQHRITVGEVKSSGAPALISTVLGSCVSACLFDPEARVGGMNHFCLPRGGDDDPTRPERYGVHAMELLVNELLGLGAQRSRLVAKIFGGAKVTVGLSDVGAGNVRFVREFLSAEKIAVAAEHVGGTRPLEIHLVSSTGKVYVREVPATRAVIASETRALRTVETRPVVSEVTLFGS